MHRNRFMWGLLLAVMLPASAETIDSPPVPTAQEILDKAMNEHTSASTYEGTATSRGIMLLLVGQPGQDVSDTRFEIRRQQYRQVDLHARMPDEWAVVSDNQAVYSSESGVNRSQFNRTILIKTRDHPPMVWHGDGLDHKRVLKEATDKRFNEDLQVSLFAGYGSDNMQGDIVFRYCLPGARGFGNISWGLLSPEIRSEEAGKGDQKTYCIEAKSLQGRPVLVWVETPGFRVRRVVQLDSSTIRQYEFQHDYIGRDCGFTETVYNYDTNRELTEADFTDHAGDAMDFTAAGNQACFADIKDIISLLSEDIKMADPDYRLSLQREAARAKGAKRVADARSDAAAVKEGQYLTAEQMNGIVVIEGDKGRASGFMTSIKGVDFVVTNLHVLGANSTITLKSMRGEVIPYNAIYGLVGRDIAILRIAKAAGKLSVIPDLMKSLKMGDRVVVVGNRQGSGVATELTGSVKGIGPDRIEVDASFQPGNSGSPIVSLATGEVVGVATYLQKQVVDVMQAANSRLPERSFEVQTRWFGFRLDGDHKWEAINMERWKLQGKQIDKFRDESDALLAVLRLQFNAVKEQPRLTQIIEDFKTRVGRAGRNNVVLADEVKDFMRKVRAFAEEDIKDIAEAPFYDYYRNCLYWEQNIQAQQEYRSAIVRVLKVNEGNPLPLIARLHGG